MEGSFVGWGDAKEPQQAACQYVGVRKLTPTYRCQKLAGQMRNQTVTS